MAFAFLAAAEICSAEHDARWVFGWFALAVLVDATDGPLARRWHVTTHASRIDGRKIDDLVDYLNYTFLPLLLVWRMQWLPAPAAAWIVPALIASLFGFSQTAAKQETEGFFLGFPSYWNIYAFYAGLWSREYGPAVPATVLALLTVLTLLPVRFLYPTMTPHPWRWPILLGAGLWLVQLLAMLPRYPHIPRVEMWLSLVYPAFYLILSVRLDRAARRRGERFVNT
jgi:phosphatidylcholine synthase